MDKTILIIGYGNPLRGDDGVGPVVIDILKRTLPENAGVTLIDRHQLDIADAEDIAACKAVVFIDAHVSDERDDVDVYRLEPSTATEINVTHISSPEELMAIAKAVYDKAPPAFVCAVRGYDFSFGSPLTGATRALAEDAVDKIARLVEEL